jgi:predicted outer membrane protein
MIESLALIFLLADTPPADATLPRRRDANAVEQRTTDQEQPTDPLFDRKFVATDDPAFVLGAIESSRQGVFDARSAEQRLRTPALRDAAAKIERQNETTRLRLETLAKRKGWRVPDGNPGRANTAPTTGEARAAANFIVNQISYHQNTVEQFRAQLDGKGDADLKSALREALPGYQRNLELLLTLDL